MVIDSSAALAILLGEADDELFASPSTPTRIMSAVSVLETSIVVEARKGPVAGRELDLFCTGAGSTSFRSMHTSWTWRGTPTAALAKDIIVLHSISATAAPSARRGNREPLLFKGGDFTHTDIPKVLSPA